MHGLFLLLSLCGEQDPKYELFYLFVHGRREDTLVYDLNGDGRLDVLNTSIDFDVEPPTRWLAYHIRTEDGRLPLKPDYLIPVDDRAAALIFGDFLPGGGIEAGFLAPEGVFVHRFGPKGPSEIAEKILHLRTFFTAVSNSDLPVWSYAKDLDGDGRHDLVVPLFDEYRVFFQTEPGRFGKSVVLEEGLSNSADRSLSAARFASRPEGRSATVVVSRELPLLTAADIDGDGRTDLVTLHQDVMTYFFQRPRRVFSSGKRTRYKYPIPTLVVRPEKNKIEVPVIGFVDINKDRKSDLVVTKIEGQLGLLESLETKVYLHLGTGRGNFRSDQAITVRGVSINPTFVDMDGDGYLDCMVSRLRTDLLRQGGQLLLFGNIYITYEIFQFDPRMGGFRKDPVYEKAVSVNKDDLTKKGRGTVPLLFIAGDLTGDGRPDMVAIDPKTEELRIHRGEVRWSGDKPIISFQATPSFRWRVERSPKSLEMIDANGDGLQDILLKHSGGVGILESRRRP